MVRMERGLDITAVKRQIPTGQRLLETTAFCCVRQLFWIAWLVRVPDGLAEYAFADVFFNGSSDSPPSYKFNYIDGSRGPGLQHLDLESIVF